MIFTKIKKLTGYFIINNLTGLIQLYKLVCFCFLMTLNAQQCHSYAKCKISKPSVQNFSVVSYLKVSKYLLPENPNEMKNELELGNMPPAEPYL